MTALKLAERPKLVALAVKRAGGVAALAKALGIKHSSIYHWTKIPAERVVAIEAVTGVPREQLRPDLFKGMKTR